MATFDNLSPVNAVLQPSPTLRVPPKQDTGAIEEAAGSVERAEASEGAVRASEINTDLLAGKEVSGIAISALKIEDQYHQNSYNAFLGQLEGIHSAAASQIRGTEDPESIQQIASHASAAIAGLVQSEANLPKSMADSLGLAASNYGNSLHQAAAVKTQRIAVDSDLINYNNSGKAFYSNIDASLRNEEDPRKRQLLLKQVSDRIDSLNSLYAQASTLAQKNKIAGLVSQARTWMWAQTQPSSPVPDIGISEALQFTSSNALKQSESAKHSVINGFLGGDPRDMSYEDASSNPDYQNGYLAAQQGKVLNGALANSHSIPLDIARLRSSESYSSHIVADYMSKKLAAGQADQIAWSLSPSLRDAHNKMMNAPPDSSQYEDAKKDYGHRLKSWMDYHGMPDSSYNPLTQDQRDFLDSVAEVTSKDDVDSRYLKQSNRAIAMLASSPDAFIGGTGWQNNALRSCRFSNLIEDEKGVSPVYPQEFNNLYRSYSPEVQKSVSNDRELFSDPDTFNGLTYNNFAGNKSHIQSMKDLSSYVQQNASSFMLANLSTATGNPLPDLIRSTSALIGIKVKAGESAESAISDVKNEYNEMLTAHPIVSGRSQEGYRIAVNPQVMQNYGASFVAPDTYNYVLGKAADKTYNRIAEQQGLQFSSPDGIKSSIFSKADQDITRKRNLQYIGDKKDAHVISSNGRLYLRTANGRTFPIRAADIAQASKEAQRSKKAVVEAKKKAREEDQEASEALQFANPFL